MHGIVGETVTAGVEEAGVEGTKLSAVLDVDQMAKIRFATFEVLFGFSYGHDLPKQLLLVYGYFLHEFGEHMVGVAANLLLQDVEIDLDLLIILEIDLALHQR